MAELFPGVSMVHGALSEDYEFKQDYGQALHELQLRLTMDGERGISEALRQSYVAGGR